MIAFRLDANSQIATGHMFRCIAIAKQCLLMGEECVFLLAEDQFTEILQKNNLKYHILNVPWDDWNKGIAAVKECISTYKIDCLLVDSYRVTEQFFREITPIVPTFYMDDLCTVKYDVTAALHYSEWPDEHIIDDLYADTKVQTYSGMQYMPLREGFHPISDLEERLYKLIITTGGTDSYHITLKLLQRILKQNDLAELPVCVVLGKMNTDVDAIRSLGASYDNITILQNISDMNVVMRKALLAVTACGTSVYELMASGVPFISFGFSEDHVYFGKRLQAHGNSVWTGDARENADAVVENMVSAYRDLLSHSEADLQDLASRNRELLDGKGARRIAEVLLQIARTNE